MPSLISSPVPQGMSSNVAFSKRLSDLTSLALGEAKAIMDHGKMRLEVLASDVCEGTDSGKIEICGQWANSVGSPRLSPSS